jgi:ribosome-binding protein aMBF1 (putative translation factor)
MTFVANVLWKSGSQSATNFCEEMNDLRLRKQALGTRNLVGARVEMARKNLGMKQKELLAQLQVNGIDMNASGLSKLEGQIRYVTDYELSALANILNVSVDWLLGREEK